LADKISEACADYGIRPVSAYECSDAFSIIGLVSTGLGWSVVPDLEFRDVHATGIGDVQLPQKKP
jgi:DNA-binding transcriptional LysR family regulator